MQKRSPPHSIGTGLTGQGIAPPLLRIGGVKAARFMKPDVKTRGRRGAIEADPYAGISSRGRACQRLAGPQA